MEGRGAIKSYSVLPTQGTLLRKSCSGMPPPQDVGVGCLQRYNVSRGVTSSMCASRGMYSQVSRTVDATVHCKQRITHQIALVRNPEWAMTHLPSHC